MKAFAVGSGPNRLLRFGIGVLALLMCLIALHNLLTLYPWGVDVVIPLKAATRWLAGGQPYLASSFLNGAARQLGLKMIPSVPMLHESPLRHVIDSITAASPPRAATC